jgi:hypothetical protein
MHLVQILLPLYDKAGKRFPQRFYDDLKVELSKKFGGLTAYTRSPAEGLWKRRSRTLREDIIVYEVMTRMRSASWWKQFRKQLESRFKQTEIIVRAQSIVLL